MIQLNLFDNLCGEFHLHLFSQKKKKLKQLDLIRQEITALLSDGAEYLHQHILNKIIQYTQSEFGFIAKPIKNVIFDVDKFAETRFVTKPAEFRCITDCAVNEKTFKEGQIYIDNKLCKRYPEIKRFVVCPIMNKGEMVAFIVLCNRYKVYKKKELIPLKEMLEEFSYIFTNQLFI